MAEKELLKDRGKDIKYITIELMDKKKVETIEGGLFRGIDTDVSNPDKPKLSVLVYDPTTKVSGAYSLEAYTITSFEICEVSRTIWFFLNTDLDQKAAMDEVLLAMYMMREAGRMTNNNDVINVDSYTNIPKKIGGETVAPARKNYSSVDYSNTNHIKRNVPATIIAGGYTAPTVVTKRDGASDFVRKTKVSYTLLKKMRDKIRLIQEGTYQNNAFPNFGEDTDTEVDTTTISTKTADTSDDAEWDNQWNHLGCYV